MHKRFFPRLLCLLLAAAVVLSLTACGKTRMVQSELYAMNTSISLTAYGSNAETGLSAAQSIIKSLDESFDTESSTSTVYEINHAEGKTVVISGQMATAITEAQTVYTRSGGALDLTIYPTVVVWGFNNGKYYVPTGVDLLETVAYNCFDQVTVTSYPASGTYTLTAPSTCQMTLAAVGRGAAAKYALDAMSNAGVTSGFVSMSGDVQTLGTKPDGSLWTVAIQDPKNPDSYVGTLSVGQTAVVTSGGYMDSFTDVTTGSVYQHILKPTTGLSVSNSLQSVIIVAEDGILADCLSTAMYVLGKTQAMSYWRAYGSLEGEEFEMILISEDNTITCTSGLIEQFTLSNTGYTVEFTE